MYSEEGAQQEVFPVDGKAFYTFGRESTAVDVVLSGAEASRTHAALVHHEDGKTYLIDLQSVQSYTEGGSCIFPLGVTHLTCGCCADARHLCQRQKAASQ